MYILNSKIESFYLDKEICGDYPPMFYETPTKAHKILSLGLNPSLTDTFKDVLKKRKLTLLDIQKSKNTEREKKIEALIDYQAELKFGLNEIKPIPYFNHLANFFSQFKKKGYNNFKENVYHYDLCKIRNTDSKKVISKLKDEALLFEALCQLELVINELNPEIIFVFNAAVSKLLKEQQLFFKNQKIDELDGCYYYKNIPVILANQLSGGATSTVYKEILIWNANRIINHK